MQQITITEKEIPATFRSWCKKAFKDNLDKIDFCSVYDRTLTIAENKILLLVQPAGCFYICQLYFYQPDKLPKNI